MHKRFLGIFILVFCLTISSSAFAEGLKIGVIDFRRAGLEYKKAKQFQEELETKREETQKELDKMAEEVRKVKDEMDLLSEEAKEKKQEELRGKTIEFNEFRKQKSEELLLWRDTKMREIGRDIIDATSEFAKKHSYDMIIDRMASVYSLDKYDITDRILKELNK